jgi:hypothetical protein
MVSPAVLPLINYWYLYEKQEKSLNEKQIHELLVSMSACIFIAFILIYYFVK